VTIWGDVNAVLNGLVRDGRIAGYRTNMAQVSAGGRLSIRLAASPGEDAEQVRRTVLRAMARLGIVADVELRDAGDLPAFD
jgi:hypothetical protein